VETHDSSCHCQRVPAHSVRQLRTFHDLMSNATDTFYLQQPRGNNVCSGSGRPCQGFQYHEFHSHNAHSLHLSLRLRCWSHVHCAFVRTVWTTCGLPCLQCHLYLLHPRMCFGQERWHVPCFPLPSWMCCFRPISSWRRYCGRCGSTGSARQGHVLVLRWPTSGTSRYQRPPPSATH
jgi:hypothetical protein